MTTSRSRIRRESIWPFLLAGTITLCSGFPAVVPEVSWFEVDKLGHFIAYGTLATAICRHPSVGRWPWLGAWWAFALATAYGLGDEFRQTLVSYRSYDLFDWAADAIGAAVAVGLYVLWPGYRRTLEMPVRRRTQRNPAEHMKPSGSVELNRRAGHPLPVGEQRN
jgi:VanZ family protein